MIFQGIASSPLIIGDHVTIGHSVILHGCRIGNECLVGMGSIVMDDVVVEDRVMIGAGSLVSPGKVLKGGHLYIGRPAVAVRELTEEELAWLGNQVEELGRIVHIVCSERIAELEQAASPKA